MGIKEGITAKKVIKIFIICLIVGFILFVFAIIQTVKTKSTNISKKAPYKEVLGKELVTKRPIRLFMEQTPTKKEYPYAMSDTNQTFWKSYTAMLQADEPVIKLSDSVEANAKVIFDKAVMYTNGVSGSSNPRLFGTLTSADGKTYKVEFLWGTYDYNYPWKVSQRGYLFELAPWQTVKDTTHYYLPNAEWW